MAIMTLCLDNRILAMSQS